ncbi:VWA domain-containing protein [Variovorax sp.]|uniref:VWA domain-containing protein n=1 Tax=Variovorax sp. TaxID=1871043 RepID=UPI002D2BFB97|nr:VWA domain-containing protein [Variovorax sp.]HYP86076.1 VWA domain-containing protein [Variovorax sp.]
METLAQFHFLRPWWLLALLPAALLLWAIGRREDVRRRWRQVISPHLLEALVVDPGRRRRLRPVHLTAALIAVGAIAAAGPTWERERPPFLEEKAPLAIAIDLSPSMNAVDVSPTRLERAKLKVKALLAQRGGARTAIYAYAGTAHMVLPLTDDAQLIQTFVDALQTRIMPVPGKNTALALRTIDTALSKEDTPGTIVFFTDGVEAGAFQALQAQADSGRSQPVVLAFGTERGGPIRSADGDGDGGGFARLDLQALKRLKSQTDVPVATVTLDGDEDVQWVQHRVQSHLAQKIAESGGRWKEAGWWLTLPTVLLAALWFRKGWTVRWISAWMLAVALGLAGAGMPRDAAAQGLVSSKAPEASGGAEAGADLTPPPWRFIDLWLTRDQQGRRAFEQGRYAQAAALFEDPMWRGLALYRAGRFADAAQVFAQVDSAQGDFNEGDAVAMQGRYEEAALRFQAALQDRPDWKAARDNLALVQQLAEQKKKDEDGEEEQPDLKPDEIKFDQRGKKGKKATQTEGGQGDDEMWMRNIQTSPTLLLARKFALQAAQPSAAPRPAPGRNPASQPPAGGRP